MPMYDAFSKFNYSKNGLLAPPEVWSMFAYFHIDATAEDIVDFVNAADVDRDGNVSYKEFVEALLGLNGPLDAAEEESGAPAAAPVGARRKLLRQLSDTPVAPRGAERLREIQVPPAFYRCHGSNARAAFRRSCCAPTSWRSSRSAEQRRATRTASGRSSQPR